MGYVVRWHLHTEEHSIVVVRISSEPLAGGVMLLLVRRGRLGPWGELWTELGFHADRPTV